VPQLRYDAPAGEKDAPAKIGVSIIGLVAKAPKRLPATPGRLEKAPAAAPAPDNVTEALRKGFQAGTAGDNVEIHGTAIGASTRTATCRIASRRRPLNRRPSKVG